MLSKFCTANLCTRETMHDTLSSHLYLTMPSYARNKKAPHEYEILDTLEAGLVLSGREVKSIRTGTIRLLGSYVSIQGDEAWIVGVHIPRYKYDGTGIEYDPERPRKLLLKKQEIAYLQGKSKEKGLTIVPLSVYSKGRHIKVDIGIARGKKLHDKQKTLKARAIDRDIQRDLRQR